VDGEVLRSAAYLWYFLSLVVLKKKVQASRLMNFPFWSQPEISHHMT